MNAIAEITKATRLQQRMSMREFAEALTESVKGSISHASVHEWEQGAEPNTDLMLQILVAHRDWRRAFAAGVLQAKLPEVFVDQADELRDALLG